MLKTPVAISWNSAMKAWNTARAAFRIAKPTFATACAKVENAAVIEAAMVEELGFLTIPVCCRGLYTPLVLEEGLGAPQRSDRDVNTLYSTAQANIHHYRQVNGG